VQLADTPSPQSATLGLHPVAIATEGRRLNWPDKPFGVYILVIHISDEDQWWTCPRIS